MSTETEYNETMLAAPADNTNKNKQALYNCNWCSKPFKYPSQLKEHIRVHTREKPYPCSYCSKAFSHSSALTQHERIHTGEKPFKCSWCDKSFSQSSNLKRHERVHNGPGPNRRQSKTARQGLTDKNGRTTEDTGRPTKKSRRSTLEEEDAIKMNVMVDPPAVLKPEPFAVKIDERDRFLSPFQTMYNPRDLYRDPRYSAGKNKSSKRDEIALRLFASSPNDSKESPSRIMTTPQATAAGEENYEPTPEIGSDHFVQRCRQAALNKSIESYLDCGTQSMSPIIQDDVSNFLMTRLAWSPSGFLASPRSPLRSAKSPSVVARLDMKDELPSSSLSRIGMGIVESPTREFLRANLGDKLDKASPRSVGHFRF